MKQKQTLRMVYFVALIAVSGGAAEAAPVYSDTVLARGPEYGSSIELSLPGPGNYSVTAKDLKWLDVPLQALSFGVFTAKAPIETMVGAGTLEFFNAGEGKVFLQLYARPGVGKSAGLIGLHVDSFAVVPLPASLWLLLSALGSTAFWSWGRRHGARPDDGLAASALPAAI
jgi:hypothetical protein